MLSEFHISPRPSFLFRAFFWGGSFLFELGWNLSLDPRQDVKDELLVR